MNDLIPQDAFVGLPLWRLALLVYDGEHSEDAALRAYYDEQVRDALDFATKDKADSYAAVIERMGMTITLAKEEIDLRTGKRLLSSGKPYPGDIKRLKDRIQSTEKALEDLTQRALAAMKIMGVKEIAGNTCTLRALGVAPSCEVYDESKIASEFRTASVEWTGTSKQFAACVIDGNVSLPFTECKFSGQIDKRALLKSLKQPCQNCMGTGRERSIGLETYPDCSICNGSGTNQIPGARLITERFRLVVE